MPKVSIRNMSGADVGELELSDGVFGIEPNEAVLHQAVVMQQASARRGTHKVKNRAAVRGGGRKPWRQKGTGRARHGSIRSPIWVGGGVVFGPTPRDYSFRLPKKVRRLAIKSALSAKVKEDGLIVLDQLRFEEPKTKNMVQVLKNLDAREKALIVTKEKDDNTYLSARNIPGVTCITSNNLNVIDLLAHDTVIMTVDAVQDVEEVLSS